MPFYFHKQVILYFNLVSTEFEFEKIQKNHWILEFIYYLSFLKKYCEISLFQLCLTFNNCSIHRKLKHFCHLILLGCLLGKRGWPLCQFHKINVFFLIETFPKVKSPPQSMWENSCLPMATAPYPVSVWSCHLKTTK